MELKDGLILYENGRKHGGMRVLKSCGYGLFGFKTKGGVLYALDHRDLRHLDIAILKKERV